MKPTPSQTAMQELVKSIRGQLKPEIQKKVSKACHPFEVGPSHMHMPPPSSYLETSKAGCAQAAAEMLEWVGMLQYDEDTGAFQADAQGRSLLFFCDDLTAVRTEQVMDLLYSKFPAANRTAQNSKALLSCFKSMIVLNGRLHMYMHQIGCIYNICYGGFLQVFQMVLGWTRITRDAVSDGRHRQAVQMLMLIHQECKRDFLQCWAAELAETGEDGLRKLELVPEEGDENAAEFRKKALATAGQDHDSSVPVHVTLSDLRTMKVGTILGTLHSDIENKKAGILGQYGQSHFDEVEAFGIQFIHWVDNASAFDKARTERDPVLREYITKQFLPLFQATGKRNYVQAVLRMLDHYKLDPAILETIRINDTQVVRHANMDPDNINEQENKFIQNMKHGVAKQDVLLRCMRLDDFLNCKDTVDALNGQKPSTAEGNRSHTPAQIEERRQIKKLFEAVGMFNHEDGRKMDNTTFLQKVNPDVLMKQTVADQQVETNFAKCVACLIGNLRTPGPEGHNGDDLVHVDVDMDKIFNDENSGENDPDLIEIGGSSELCRRAKRILQAKYYSLNPLARKVWDVEGKRLCAQLDETRKRQKHDAELQRLSFLAAAEACESGDAELCSQIEILLNQDVGARGPSQTQDIAQMARDIYGYELRGLQKEVVLSLARRREFCLHVAATGSGKTLPVVLAAIELGGIAVIVTPLVALGKQQARDINTGPARNRVLAIHISTHMSAKVCGKIVTVLKHAATRPLGKVIIVILSPQMLSPQRVWGIALLGNKDAIGALNLVAIDEVHCVPLDGEFFREEFAMLKDNLISKVKTANRSLCQTKRIAVCAMTATLTKDTLTKLQKMLGIKAFDKVLWGSISRRDINIQVNVRGGAATVQPLKKCVRECLSVDKKCKAIIYTNVAERASGSLRESMTKELAHIGSMVSDKGGDVGCIIGDTAPAMKEWLLNMFACETAQEVSLKSTGEAFKYWPRVLCGTHAAVLGIDNPYVMLTCMEGFVSEIEMFAQQMGRCGRTTVQSQTTPTYMIAVNIGTWANLIRRIAATMWELGDRNAWIVKIRNLRTVLHSEINPKEENHG
eukprot:g4758.t1